jgi:hypothetical protein
LSSHNFSQKTNGWYPECVLFVFWEKLRLDNIVSQLTDLYNFTRNFGKFQIIAKWKYENMAPKQVCQFTVSKQTQPGTIHLGQLFL